MLSSNRTSVVVCLSLIMNMFLERGWRLVPQYTRTPFHLGGSKIGDYLACLSLTFFKPAMKGQKLVWSFYWGLSWLSGYFNLKLALSDIKAERRLLLVCYSRVYGDDQVIFTLIRKNDYDAKLCQANTESPMVSWRYILQFCRSCSWLLKPEVA